MKRIIFVAMIAFILSIPIAFAASQHFSDISGSEWYSRAVMNLVEKGIITGYEDKTFRSSNNINRAELAVIIDRLIDHLENNDNYAKGIDAPRVKLEDVIDASWVFLKSPEHDYVYRYGGITERTRRPFINKGIYNSYEKNFDKVKEISAEEMRSLPLGDPMPINTIHYQIYPNKYDITEVKLLKFSSSSAIYAPTVQEVFIKESPTAYKRLTGIQEIPSDEAASALFGDDWRKNIVEVPEMHEKFYVKGPPIDYSPERPLSLSRSLLIDMTGSWEGEFHIPQTDECIIGDAKYYALYASGQEHDPFYMTLYNEANEMICGYDTEEGNEASCMNHEEIRQMTEEWSCRNI